MKGKNLPKFEYLEKKKAFWMKQKPFFIVFEVYHLVEKEKIVDTRFK